MTIVDRVGGERLTPLALGAYFHDKSCRSYEVSSTVSMRILSIPHMVLALVLFLVTEACNSRAIQTTQISTPTQLPTILAIEVTKGPHPFTSNVSPEPTPTAYFTQGDTLTDDLKTNYKTHLLLGMDQKLIIVPPEEWGYDGWDVAFDDQFLQLDPQINMKYPPVTGWIWTPKQTGQTRLRIVSIVPCLNFNPPCSMPNFGGFIDVTIVEHLG